MDKKTKEALEVIEKIKEPNDVIYEIIRKEKNLLSIISSILC